MSKRKIFKDLSTKTVSTDISILDEKHVNFIRKQFSFVDDYNVQSGIDDAVINYKLLSKMPKDPTPKQTDDRFEIIENMISELTMVLDRLSLNEKVLIIESSENRPKRFCANDSIDYLNELFLQIKIARSKQENVINKGGRNKKAHQSVLLSTLYSVYEAGTNQKVKCWYSEPESKYKGAFVEFCEYVINIYRLDAKNSTIGEFVKKKRKTDSIKR